MWPLQLTVRLTLLTAMRLKAAAKASSDQLKDAEESLTKETASPALAAAIDKCALKKNVYKRKCIQAIHEARDSCDKLTSAFSDDGNTSR